jgi:hypothetical protein
MFTTGLALFTIDLDLAYTYALGIAGFLTYSLTGQPPELLYALATPTLYAPFHGWLMAKVRYCVVCIGADQQLARAVHTNCLLLL